MRPSAIHASVDEWNKIATELLRRGVVTAIDRAELPLVGGRPVLVGHLVWDRQVPIPPATPVLQLIKNAVMSNTQHISLTCPVECLLLET